MPKSKRQNAEQAAHVQIANLQRCNDNQRAQLEGLIRERDHFSKSLSRYGRHDQACPAFGSFNCDPKCTCGFARACGIGLAMPDNRLPSNLAGKVFPRGRVSGLIYGPCEFVATGEFRAPRKGEFYLSGAIIQAWKAPADLTSEYWIAVQVPKIKPAGDPRGTCVSL